MRRNLESEISELKSNIHRMQKMENILSESSIQSEKLTEMKKKLQVSFLVGYDKK